MIKHPVFFIKVFGRMGINGRALAVVSQEIFLPSTLQMVVVLFSLKCYKFVTEILPSSIIKID